MSEAMEKRAEALLEEEAQGNAAEGEAQEEAQKPVEDPIEILKMASRGKMKLAIPFRAASQDVTELEYDLCALSGNEMIEALDSVPVNNMFAITNEQALALFAASAAKHAPNMEDGNKRGKLYDAKDVRQRISGVDSIKAVQIAKLFYNASSRVGNSNISNG